MYMKSLIRNRGPLRKASCALQTFFAAECASQPIAFISSHLSDTTIQHILNSLSDIKDMDSLKVVCPLLDDHYTWITFSPSCVKPGIFNY